jgi:hypothetical protein
VGIEREHLAIAVALAGCASSTMIRSAGGSEFMRRASVWMEQTWHGADESARARPRPSPRQRATPNRPSLSTVWSTNSLRWDDDHGTALLDH